MCHPVTKKVVVVLKKDYYMLKNSLCGLINNISMQYDYLSSLVMVMSLCELVSVWQYDKVQSHSCEEGCNGNVDLLSYVWSEVLCDLDGVDC